MCEPQIVPPRSQAPLGHHNWTKALLCASFPSSTMTQMTLPEKLHIAWNRVKEDRKTDFIIGDFEYKAFDAHKDDLLSHLANRIGVEGRDFAQKELRRIRVPKPSFTTRPGAVPELDDRIFFQSSSTR